MSTSTEPAAPAARVHLSAGATGPRLALGTGLLAPRVVRLGARHAEVTLVATTASLLGGDELRLDVDVGPGQHLVLRDAAATVAYHGRGLGCRVEVQVRVHAGGSCVWAGEPLVVADGARVHRSVTVDVAAGGRLLLRDQVVLGRHGEPRGSLRCDTRLAHAGSVALAETLDLAAEVPPRAPGTDGTALRDRVGVLGTARVVDTVTALGWRPTVDADVAPVVFQLQAPGAMGRSLAQAAHLTAMPALWDDWQRQLTALSRDARRLAASPEAAVLTPPA